MIVGERIMEVTGNKKSMENISGLNINITLEDVQQAKDGNLELTYIYMATYEKDVGNLKIKGVILAKEDDKLTKEIIDAWKKNKRVVDSYAETVLGAVNYSGSANGTLVARVLGLTAPLIPPRIQMSPKK
ncbi:hypothetical protein HY988_07530 [Candidatus Micrarchaeota archaeon]|nr:hypothetical protein [Candidatus Micrarchaeota archaeon]